MQQKASRRDIKQDIDDEDDYINLTSDPGASLAHFLLLEPMILLYLL